MKIRSVYNSDAVLITTEQCCELLNLGRNSVRDLAKNANATVKIGKSMRIDRKKILDYLEVQNG